MWLNHDFYVSVFWLSFTEAASGIDPGWVEGHWQGPFWMTAQTGFRFRLVSGMVLLHLQGFKDSQGVFVETAGRCPQTWRGGAVSRSQPFGSADCHLSPCTAFMLEFCTFTGTTERTSLCLALQGSLGMTTGSTVMLHIDALSIDSMVPLGGETG